MTTELKIDEFFLEYLRGVADSKEQNAAYGGRQDDGGAGRLRDQLCAYKSGRDGQIPAFWVEHLKEYQKVSSLDYIEYQRLKKKYER
jgi:hypothetical protein